MPELLQDAIVTAVALGALAFLVRRVFGLVRAGRTEPRCASCPSATNACAPRSARARSHEPVPVQLVVSRKR
jgi:hypothetical protein